MEREREKREREREKERERKNVYLCSSKCQLRDVRTHLHKRKKSKKSGTPEIDGEPICNLSFPSEKNELYLKVFGEELRNGSHKVYDLRRRRHFYGNAFSMSSLAITKRKALGKKKFIGKLVEKKTEIEKTTLEITTNGVNHIFSEKPPLYIESQQEPQPPQSPLLR